MRNEGMERGPGSPGDPSDCTVLPIPTALQRIIKETTSGGPVDTAPVHNYTHPTSLKMVRRVQAS